MEVVVSEYFNRIWRLMFVWKCFMVIAVVLFSVVLVNIEQTVFAVDLTDGIKAPFFALASASTLFMGMIPTNQRDVNDVVADVLIRLAGAGTACLAAWHWLLGEVEGDASPYLLELMPLMLIIGIIVLMPFLSHAITSAAEVISSKSSSGDEESERLTSRA